MLKNLVMLNCLEVSVAIKVFHCFQDQNNQTLSPELIIEQLNAQKHNQSSTIEHLASIKILSK